MKLTEIFTGEKQVADTAAKIQNTTASNTALVNRQIQALVPGQTIQGELVARNGNEVQIKLSDDITIKARLEQNMNLEIGKNITFEVKNNGSSLVLNPLYTNVATDANVLKALEMASLPVNADAIEMTDLMMKAGLSINKNSLQQVFREYNQFANVDIADIVDLHKLAMPVNESNLSQIASYKNLNHQLVTGLNDCMEVLPDTIQNLLQSGDVAGAEKLYQELLNMIHENSITGTEATGTEITGTGTTVFAENNLPSAMTGENPAVIQTSDGQLLVLDMPIENGGQILSFPGDAKLLQTLLQPENSQLLQTLAQGENSELVKALSEGDPVQLLKALTRLETGENTQNTGNIDANQLLQNTAIKEDNQLFQILMQGNNRQALQGLIQSGDGVLLQTLAKASQGAAQDTQLTPLKDYLQNNLQNLWTLRPEEVADAKRVEQFYDRLDSQLKNLAHVLESVHQTGSEAYRATTNLTQNLDFLQQINQAYTFVQLPLRLQQGNNAHGELFVYTNKKHLAAKDGQISALLHLDMENLGPVDVYVAMQYEKVSTKFYVKDDEMLDFLEAHMDILTERLKARGYHYTCEMLTRDTGEEQQQSGIHQILQANGHVPVVQYAFDVRT